MKAEKHPQLPSSSLPSLRATESLTENQILSALENLSAIYCPLPVPVSLDRNSSSRLVSRSPAPAVDSGYASEVDNKKKPSASREETLKKLRADAFERGFAERWLTGFIGRADTLLRDGEEITSQFVVDQAACILESLFSMSMSEDPLEEDSDDSFIHEFNFDIVLPKRTASGPLNIRLRDRLAGTNASDHDDVGLQIWGASIIFSDLICSSSLTLGLDRDRLGPSPRIIELGAGTGLVSLVLSSALPRLGFVDPTVISTDYNPQVLENLRSNIEENGLPVETALLDWSSPVLDPPLNRPANMLVAADVVYGPEHATLLRDCAFRLLAPDGIFWLLASIRQNGRFNGISATVKTAFESTDSPQTSEGRRLKILRTEELEKRKGIGREDESGYLLFRIEWA